MSTPPPSAVTIGTFDGIHRGHQLVLEYCLEIAQGQNMRPVVLTFEPHPRDVLRPNAPVFRITSQDVKEHAILALGGFSIETLPFSPMLAQLSATDFVEQILVKGLGAKHVIVGEDFHFGKSRLGTPAFLQAQGKRQGFEVTLIPPHEDENGEIISSSRIRDALRAGDIAQANALLGYSWRIKAVVQHGAKRGRVLGFPTANLHMPTSFALKHGVYAVQVHTAAGESYIGAASFGTRPQFDDGPPKLEVFMMGFSGDLYGQEILVQFISFLRAEQKFEGVDALIAQMNRDIQESCAVISGYGLKRFLDSAAV